RGAARASARDGLPPERRTLRRARAAWPRSGPRAGARTAPAGAAGAPSRRVGRWTLSGGATARLGGAARRRTRRRAGVFRAGAQPAVGADAGGARRVPSGPWRAGGGAARRSGFRAGRRARPRGLCALRRTRSGARDDGAPRLDRGSAEGRSRLLRHGRAGAARQRPRTRENMSDDTKTATAEPQSYGAGD